MSFPSRLADVGADEPVPAMIRVLVADDDPFARRMVCDQLGTSDVQVLGQARDGEEAVKMALELRPDVVVMDLLMPGCDGITATQRIAIQAPEIQVVILSVSGDEDVVLMALRSGAVGFLDKGIEMDALLRVVRGVGRGEAALNRHMTRRLIAEFRSMAASGDVRTHRTQAGGSTLSPRETQILELLAEGMTTEAISADLGLAIETVRTHIKGVLRKLRVHTRREAIERAREIGIVPALTGAASKAGGMTWRPPVG